MVREVKIGYIDTVHGICPHCDEDTLLVAIVTDYYKCTHYDRDWETTLPSSRKALRD